LRRDNAIHVYDIATAEQLRIEQHADWVMAVDLAATEPSLFPPAAKNRANL
jgi:hypothetical protein